MTARWPQVAAWGALAALLAVGAAVIATRDAGPSHDAPVSSSKAREVALTVAPASFRTGTTTTLVIAAADGEALLGGEADVWIVRGDLAWLTHAATRAEATSSLALPFRPTEPGAYRVVLESLLPGGRTVGTGTFAAAGPPGDAPPRELSAAREGFRVTLSSIPDAGAIVAGEPVSLTYAVERTGTPITLDERDGARGMLAAFREGGGFVRGVPMAPELLPSSAASTFSLAFPQRGRYRLFFEFAADGKSYVEAEWVDVR